MGKQSSGQKLRGIDRTPLHPHVGALVWDPYLLDASAQVSQVLQRQHQSTTPEQALSVLLRTLEAQD
jgi:hypothetical protein